MNPKVLIAAAIFVAAPVLALAEQADPAEPTPRPTVDDVRKFVQSIIADTYKLRAYCDLGNLQREMDEAEAKNDTTAIDALVVKADGLEEQLGSEYERIMDELEQLKPDSPEAQKFSSLFKALDAECK